jgi:histidinol-phosphatase (PHP family)
MQHTVIEGLPDYHTHTHLCKHAEGEPLDYFGRMKTVGIGQMATTDHCPSPHAYDPSHRMTMSEFDTYKRWGIDLRNRYPEHVRFGIEADFYQGCLEFQKPFLAEQDFDVVLGSVHYQCYWSHDKSEQTLFDKPEREHVWTRYFHLVRLMAESGLYDIACHLDLPKRQGKRMSEDFVMEAADRALVAIRDAGMAIEINTSGLRHPVAELYPAPYLLKEARRMGIPITFGSDAHKPEEVGRDFDRALQAARDAGYTEMALYHRRRQELVPLP